MSHLYPRPSRVSKRAGSILLLPFLLMTLQLSVSPASAQTGNNVVINSANLTNIRVVGSVLKADGTVTGTLAGFPFTTNITNFALSLVPDDPSTQQVVECSVLDLQLAPIHLQLLGLHVDTSAICLEITATQGGGLLGDLLCGLAGGGLPVLPNAGQQATLQAGLVDILNGSLNSNPNGPGNGSVCTGQCRILDLAIGPVNLTLLGLNVALDNCANGPVQICVSASRNEGILGQLLCGLTNTQLLNLTLADITQLISRAFVLAAGGLTRQEIAELTALLLQLVRR
jgi:hypothetical protein